MLAVLFQLERAQWLAPEKIWERQRGQLQALLRHSVAEVPYYRHRMGEAVRSLPSQFSLHDYSRLPLLRRADIQEHFRDSCAERLPAGHGGISQSTTSGSTGEPVRFLSTSVSTFFWQAFMLREHLWHKRDFSARMLAIRVEKEVSISENWFGDVGAEIFRSGQFVVLPARWPFDRQLDRICEEQPSYLLGYASNVLGILRAADNRGIAMPWLREVRSFGEAVSEDMRTYILERWFVGRPLNDSEISALRAHFTDQFGHPFNWTFVFLDEFPRDPGDKLEDRVSEVT